MSLICPPAKALPAPPLTTLDFNLSKLLEGARPESSLTSAAATNPIWLVSGAGGLRVLPIGGEWQQLLVACCVST